MKKRWLKVLGAALALNMCLTANASVHLEENTVSQYMDCIAPMPIIGSLSENCWGAEEVGPRDQDNGLEDRKMENYSYWDGGIIKNKETGKYYMFASRWNQAGGHWGQDGISGWQGSQAVYAVSDNLYGPYVDQGLLWPQWCDGAGHNVFPFELTKSDPLYDAGYRYAISISDTGMHGDVANGTLHISKSLDGPWELLDNGNDGKLKASGGKGFSLSNISITVRPDGKYEATNRNGDLAIAQSIAGTWEVKENDLWQKVAGMSSSCIEDPVIWYSDGLYHIVVNKWDARMAYYLTSEDGLTNWVRRPGTAYKPDGRFLRYEDGTENHWTKLERPNIYVEDGRLVAMTFAVIDVQKEADLGNDQHGSKVIVVPFLSEKLQEVDAQPDPLDNRNGICASADTTAQTWGSEAEHNYGAETFLQLQKDPDYESYGMGNFGEGVRPNEQYDNKIGYVKFDLSGYQWSGKGEPEKVFLSVVYRDQAAGQSEKTRIQAVLCDADWQEGSGNGNENGNQTSPGDLTWNDQPALQYDADTIAQSEEFHTADMGKEVKIDVTNLFRKFCAENPDADSISFALNVTETGSRFQVASREAGKRTAPQLMFQWKKTESMEMKLLQIVIEAYKDLDLRGCTETSRKAFQEAMGDALAVLEGQTDMTAADAVSGLLKAAAGLEVDLSEREADIMAAEEAKQNIGKLREQLRTVQIEMEKMAFCARSPELKTVKSKKKRRLKVTWETLPEAEGYEILYGTKSNFKKAKKVQVKNAAAKGKNCKKLVSRKKYYVKIRAYRVIEGQKVYTKYSKVKRVKVK